MKVYVINVPAHTERLAGFQAAYPAGLPEPIVYPARTGAEVEVPAWWKGTANAWALVQNVKGILSQEHSEPVMICEDDCAFYSDFVNALETFMANVPQDWDMLFPGGRHEDLCNAYPIKVNDHVLKCRYTPGNFCVIFKPDSIQKILAILNSENWPCRHVHDDLFALAQWSGQLKAYAPLRFIAGQRGGVSSSLRDWTWHQTTFFNEFKYFDPENEVFLPAGALYDAEAEEEEEEA